MAQDGARPTRENCREDPTLGPELLVAERVHAPPEALEPTDREPVRDGPAVEAARSDLRSGDDPELPCSDDRKLGIRRRCRRKYMTVMRFLRHPPSVAEPGARGCALCDGSAT